MISTKVKFIVAGVVLLVAIGYLIVSSVGSLGEYDLTIGQLKAKEPAVYSQNVRVAGIVDGASIDRNAFNGVLKFTADDADQKLPIEYTGGAVPDIFGPGISVVVEGKLGSDGVFHATNLLAQCPSKYEDAVQPPTS
ncbi:MAG: cytochrome c maturation protein CcmE [Chloroflexi bacterium]|nr:cytochrome c maturation protein CcmE [Chloroflexota bacterium]